MRDGLKPIDWVRSCVGCLRLPTASDITLLLVDMVKLLPINVARR